MRRRRLVGVPISLTLIAWSAEQLNVIHSVAASLRDRDHVVIFEFIHSSAVLTNPTIPRVYGCLYVVRNSFSSGYGVGCIPAPRRPSLVKDRLRSQLIDG